MRIVLISATLAASACASTGSNGGELTVVTTVFPIEEAARRVAADRPVEILNVTPAGAEPHDVELAPDAVATVLDADVLLYVGGGFQPAVEELAGRRDGITVNVLDDVRLREGGDPHVWLDPLRMAAIVESVAEAITQADPAGRRDYEAASTRYREDLTALDERFESTLAQCEQRTLVVAHAAFGYLADRYDLQEAPIAGLSPEGEPDPQRLGALASLIEERGVTTIFTETLAPSDVAQTLARETGVGVAVLDPIEGLADGRDAARTTYVDLMDENLDAMAEGLGCRN